MFQTFRLSVFFVCGQFMVYCLIKSLEVIVLKLKKKTTKFKVFNDAEVHVYIHYSDL